MGSTAILTMGFVARAAFDLALVLGGWRCHSCWLASFERGFLGLGIC